MIGLVQKTHAYYYRMISLLGQGGMADVLECARVTYLGGVVGTTRYAVKILRERRDEEHHRRFATEATLLARLRHPHLIPILEVCIDVDPPYYVMPVMNGNLADHLNEMRARGRLYRSLHAIRAVLMPIAGAVEYLHKNGVVHRDIKPDNILFDMNNRPVLSDLSICHVSRVGYPELTWCGMGTENYTAPETLQTGVATARSDVFSLGVILYEMLTGQLPRGYWWNVRCNLPSVQHPQSCHPYVDGLLAQMTHPNPYMRYPTVTSVIYDLGILLRSYLPRMPAYLPPRPRVAGGRATFGVSGTLPHLANHLRRGQRQPPAVPVV